LGRSSLGFKPLLIIALFSTQDYNTFLDNSKKNKIYEEGLGFVVGQT